MIKSNFTFRNKDNINIFVYKWEPKESIKGVIQISHGMAETASRYDYFARRMVKEGYMVYANDHRGHGLSAQSIEELGYISDEDGFKDMVIDMKALTNIIKKENPKTPIILFSHSMGSFLAQRYIQAYGDAVNGVILSGTNGKQSPVVNIGIVLSKILICAKGRKAKGDILDKLVFKDYNKKINPIRTRFDWLSRDENEVDKYIDNPYCGTTFPVSFFHDLFIGTKQIHRKECLDKVPRDLPVYIFAGTGDPVGNYGKGVISLATTYKALGLKNISLKLYKDGRHEMLNELNKDQVIKDIINWTNKFLY